MTLLVRVAHAIYRLLLRCMPLALRESYGDDMDELFTEELVAARARGAGAVFRVLTSSAFDLISRAPYEHWRRRGRPLLTELKEPKMSSLFADLRFALRSFGRQPGATALVVVTLALAVAANVAVFALVDAVFFRALPYPNASRLVDINEQAPKWGLEFTGVNYTDFDTWRKTNRTFEAMALWDNSGFNLSDDNGTERIEGQQVTYDMPRALGIQPALGRSFTAEEDVPKGPNVAMIGYGLWQERFAGKRDVLGKTIRIGSAPYTIVGVLPRNVTLDGPATIWVPLRGDPKQEGESYSYEGVGRLKPGVTVEQARVDLERAHEPIWRQRDSTRTVSPRIMPLRERFVSEYRTTGAALGAGVVLVLLIACANVAGAMLARSVARRRAGWHHRHDRRPHRHQSAHRRGRIAAALDASHDGRTGGRVLRHHRSHNDAPLWPRAVAAGPPAERGRRDDRRQPSHGGLVARASHAQRARRRRDRARRGAADERRAPRPRLYEFAKHRSRLSSRWRRQLPRFASGRQVQEWSGAAALL